MAPPALQAGSRHLARYRTHRGAGHVTGLLRKQFIYAEDGWADGVYLCLHPPRSG